jgi:hypothetical protein
MKIINCQKNREILESIFENAPKTFEEALKKGKAEPILIGKKYCDFEIEENIINELFEKHSKNQCECNSNQKCYFQMYADKEISRTELVKSIEK